VRFCRFTHGDSIPCQGLIEGSRIVELSGDFLGRFERTEQWVALSAARLLPPVAPSKIVAVGVNFLKHAAEMGKALPEEPKIFLKAPSALIGHRDPVVLPLVPGAIEHEAEVAVVIGQRARHVSVERALAYVFGYTCLNDVTARIYQKIDGVYARAKGFDTFAPMGPWIETEVSWEALEVEGWVNGTRRQHGALREAIFSVPRIISFVSRVMTLFPGDVISMGTPAGVGPLQPGDEVEVRVPGVGSLSNPVIAEEIPVEVSA